MVEEFTTGELAKKAGVNIETIRYYERRGLIPEPLRSASGYRQYPADTLKRIWFIKNAQSLGFTLKEILELLSYRADTKWQCAKVKRDVKSKINQISEKVKKLEWMREALIELDGRCDQGSANGKCPILECLSTKEEDDEG